MSVNSGTRAGLAAVRGLDVSDQDRLPTDVVCTLPMPVHNPRGQVVGRIERGQDGTVTLCKAVDPDKHQLRQPPAWCLAQTHLDELLGVGGGTARVVLEGPDGTTWTASVGDFVHRGFPMQRAGFEAQVVLPLKWWAERRPGVQQLDFFVAVTG